jgi:hypothetical protein
MALMLSHSFMVIPEVSLAVWSRGVLLQSAGDRRARHGAGSRPVGTHSPLWAGPLTVCWLCLSLSGEGTGSAGLSFQELQDSLHVLVLLLWLEPPHPSLFLLFFKLK